MGRVIFNIALLLAFVATIALGLVRRDAGKTNYELFPDMAHGPRYSSFAPNLNFATGQTLQSPPPGSIARGAMPLHYTASPQDALRAGQELSNPNPPSSERALNRGQYVFANFCSECHGTNATGNGPVAQRGYPPPPSLLADKTVNMKDGQLFHVLTYGQNNMPSYASQLSREDRWDVITYLRSLQEMSRANVAKAAMGGGQ